MRSRLYEGRVWHTRRNPSYTFAYRVWYLALDLAEIADAARSLRLFGHNCHNLVSLWDSDYLLLERGQPPAPPGGSVELVTMPRFMGHVFNPVSFLLSRDSAGNVVDVTAEVHNTWSERHLYHLPREEEGEVYTSHVPKAFYVSPFLDITGDYRFQLQEEPTGRLRIRIDEHDGADWCFGSGIDVSPRPLSSGNLARLLITHPFLNLKTVAMIHWQGLRIWRRGERFRPNPSRRNQQRRSAAGDQ